jgi:hypothetical protein
LFGSLWEQATPRLLGARCSTLEHWLHFQAAVTPLPHWTPHGTAVGCSCSISCAGLSMTSLFVFLSLFFFSRNSIFSHNKSANGVFQPAYQSSQTGPTSNLRLRGACELASCGGEKFDQKREEEGAESENAGLGAGSRLYRAVTVYAVIGYGLSQPNAKHRQPFTL